MKKVIVCAGLALGILGLATAAIKQFATNYEDFREYLMKGGK